MRKNVTLAFVVVWLTLILTIPAAASKPVAVAGFLDVELLWDKTWDVGNRCFAVGESRATFFPGGDFDGTGLNYFTSVCHGPCPPDPGPMQMVETFRQEGTFDGTVLGKSGTFDYRCQKVWRPDDPDTLMVKCAITSGTDELSGLHGHFELYYTEWPFPYSGQVHFDGI
jgi:hypothetical protein